MGSLTWPLTGLYKNEAIANGSPFRTGPLKTITDVQEITFDWVDCHNNQRLHGYLGNIPSEEYEATYYAEQTAPSTGDAANNKAA